MLNSNPIPKLRVAICGGGISGLFLAVALSRYPDIAVDVYEAAERFREIGAGVMIWSRTWRILELMGLAPDFARVAHAPPDGSLGIGFDFRRSDKATEGSRFLLLQLPYGCIRFHRAAFLDVLVAHLPPGIAHFHKHLVSYSHSHSYPAPSSSSPVTLHFEDGARAQCDLLVGCDGVRSCVRAQLFDEGKDRSEGLQQYVNPVWTGSVAYRGLVPVERIPRGPDGKVHRTVECPMMYCGKNKHVVGYSISQGFTDVHATLVNVVAITSEPEKRGTTYGEPWMTPCERTELLRCYADWEPEVGRLLECIEHPTKWAIHELRPLPFYSKGKVVLVGDAAHAMAPHQGAGAGQAIEDAYVLSSLLTHRMCTRGTLAGVLGAYERVRRAQGNTVLEESFRTGKMYEFGDDCFGDHGDGEEAYKRLGNAIEQQFDWMRVTTPEGEARRAVELFTGWIRGSKL